METSEYKKETLKAADGTSIIIARYESAKPAQGVIQIQHGFGEHHNSYREMAEYFVKKEYICVVYNQRGHGEMPELSEKEKERARGVLKQYDEFLDDVALVRKKIGEWYPDMPVILYGHSMGGNIAINYLLKRSQTEYSMAVFETPWLRLYKPKPEWLVSLARFLGGISHKFAVRDELEVNAISEDAEKATKIEKDPYFHNRLSLRIFAQITDAGEYAIENAAKISLPALLFCGGEDRIVSPEAIRVFYEKTDQIKGNVELFEITQGYHSLHNDKEPVKTRMLEKMAEFLEQHIQESTGA